MGPWCHSILSLIHWITKFSPSNQGFISSMGLSTHRPNLVKMALVVIGLWWSDRVINFHMPRELSCKTLTRLDRIFQECTDFLAATKQLYKWFSPSVCLSVHPSVRLPVTPLWLCSHHRIIINCQELLPMTEMTSMQKVKVGGQRSRSQRSTPNLAVSGPYLWFEFTYDDEMMHSAWRCLGEVSYCFSRSSLKFQGHTAKKSSICTQIWHFRTVTPVWIHQWLRNDAQSSKYHKRGALLFFKVIYQISRSHGIQKKIDFDPNWAFPNCNSSLNSLMAMKCCTMLEATYKRHPIVF